MPTPTSLAGHLRTRILGLLAIELRLIVAGVLMALHIAPLSVLVTNSMTDDAGTLIAPIGGRRAGD